MKLRNRKNLSDASNFGGLRNLSSSGNLMSRCFAVLLVMVLVLAMLTACSDQNSGDGILGNQNFGDDALDNQDADNDSSDFSLVFPSGYLDGAASDTIAIFESYQLNNTPAQENVYDSDGMYPHKFKDYYFSFNENGSLYVRTDFYESEGLEYVSFMWTDIDGVKTGLGVGVGSSERELLAAYTSDMYYLDKDGDMEPVYLSFEGAPGGDFEYAYAWQPFTNETNEILDITFYMEDGAVVAIEIVKPYELRYVYGYDREAGLQRTDENRAK